MNKIHYVYVLHCNDNSKYYGHTSDLLRRLSDHSNGRVSSTRTKLPIQLVYYEECATRPEAFRREMQFKNGRTRKETIEKLILSFSKAKCQGFNSRF